MLIKKITKTLFVITLLCIDLFATEKLNVIATNSIIDDWISEIADKKINLTTIIGPDTDNHTFEPTPKDGVSLSKADLIFENGLGLEYWLDDLYVSSKSKAIRIPLSNSLHNLYKYNKNSTTCTHPNCNHSQDYDPHTWLDVSNVIAMIKIITKQLVLSDPLNASYYQTHSEIYIKKLQELDSWIFHQIKLIPLQNRKLLTNHNSMRYFALRYKFELAGDMLGSSSTESVDPSGAQFVKLIAIIKKYKIKAVFGENSHNTILLDNLTAETNLPKPQILYIESLGKKNSPAENYIALMRYNVLTIVNALK